MALTFNCDLCRLAHATCRNAPGCFSAQVKKRVRARPAAMLQGKLVCRLESGATSSAHLLRILLSVYVLFIGLPAVTCTSNLHAGLQHIEQQYCYPTLLPLRLQTAGAVAGPIKVCKVQPALSATGRQEHADGVRRSPVGVEGLESLAVTVKSRQGWLTLAAVWIMVFVR